MVRIWDPFVRLFHWSLVVTIAATWLTGDEVKVLHEPLGYVAAALITMRLLWGLVGSHYARFTQFVPSPLSFLRYLGDILSGKEKRYLGHNPAGALMILALIAMIAATAFTGWLQTTDAFFGNEEIEDIHGVFANGLLVLIALHIGGVRLASRRHGENLVRAMLTGLKRKPESGDVA
jgi:cytochrome b